MAGFVCDSSAGPKIEPAVKMSAAVAGPSGSQQPQQTDPEQMEVDDTGKSVMASSVAAGSVSAHLHPLVIMNISEHWTRIRAQEGKAQQGTDEANSGRPLTSTWHSFSVPAWVSRGAFCPLHNWDRSSCSRLQPLHLAV